MRHSRRRNHRRPPAADQLTVRRLRATVANEMAGKSATVTDQFGLPAEHPHFARHFTSSFYDADSDGNYDAPPFGTDLGADDVTEWAGRLNELQRGCTLRHMLGGERADADDNIVISLGFTLLRYTGQIDAEGRAWLIEALNRQRSLDPGSEYATVLQDVLTFGPSTKAARSTPLEPWLRIRTGGGDNALDRWCDTTCRAAALDPAWRGWWSKAGLERLTLYPHLTASRTYLEFEHPVAQEVFVIGASKRLGKTVQSILNQQLKSHTSGSLTTSSRFQSLFERLILDLLQEAASHLGMPSPPQELPHPSPEIARSS